MKRLRRLKPIALCIVLNSCSQADQKAQKDKPKGNEAEFLKIRSDQNGQLVKATVVADCDDDKMNDVAISLGAERNHLAVFSGASGALIKDSSMSDQPIASAPSAIGYLSSANTGNASAQLLLTGVDKDKQLGVWQYDCPKNSFSRVSLPIAYSAFDFAAEWVFDVNNDGTQDILLQGTVLSQATSRDTIGIISGSDGTLLSQYEASASTLQIRALPTGDFDGDSLSDILLFTSSKSLPQETEVSVVSGTSLSGANWQIVWTSSLKNEFDSASDIGDVNNDGKSEIAVHAKLRDNSGKLGDGAYIFSKDSLTPIAEKSDYAAALGVIQNDWGRRFVRRETPGHEVEFLTTTTEGDDRSGSVIVYSLPKFEEKRRVAIPLPTYRPQYPVDLGDGHSFLIDSDATSTRLVFKLTP